MAAEKVADLPPPVLWPGVDRSLRGSALGTALVPRRLAAGRGADGLRGVGRRVGAAPGGREAAGASAGAGVAASPATGTARGRADRPPRLRVRLGTGRLRPGLGRH